MSGMSLTIWYLVSNLCNAFCTPSSQEIRNYWFMPENSYKFCYIEAPIAGSVFLVKFQTTSSDRWINGLYVWNISESFVERVLPSCLVSTRRSLWGSQCEPLILFQPIFPPYLSSSPFDLLFSPSFSSGWNILQYLSFLLWDILWIFLWFNVILKLFVQFTRSVHIYNCEVKYCFNFGEKKPSEHNCILFVHFKSRLWWRLWHCLRNLFPFLTSLWSSSFLFFQGELGFEN